MSGIDGALKMHIGYGGSMSYERDKFSYSGGVYVRDLVVDPDLLTWSIFEDFIADRGIKSKVEQNDDVDKSEDEEKSDDEIREEVSDEEETNNTEIREVHEKAASGHQNQRMKNRFWVKELKMFASKIFFFV
ncbi:hypothetical protein N665_0333s0009 [Sinapis alba]|nr:hypothetical protein N665_0333s0009 [Sinapis alba]